MLCDAALPPWMLWATGGLAALALLGLVFSWLRTRGQISPDGNAQTMQPFSGPSSIGTPRSSMGGGKTFMPPPGPIAGPPTDPNAEHRAAFRRIGNAVLVQIADADSSRKPVNAWVLDRSRQGLRLAAERELRIGGMYTVRPIQAPPTAPWCAVEVRHCVRSDGQWEVGCRFLQPPPVQVLMLFG